MNSSAANVVLFTFHDASRAAAVLAAAREQAGVRSVALVGCASHAELSIVDGVDGSSAEARWLALASAVLETLSASLRSLSGSTPAADRVTLPNSSRGLATFGRLIPRGGLVILMLCCDEHAPPIEVFEGRFGSALFQRPATSRHAGRTAKALATLAVHCV